MQTFSRLPPLEALVVFEAASRLGSFSRAGIELGLTQSAVSRQIGKLEAFIGSKLFERVPTGVRLTTVGENYSIDVSRLILDIASVTDGVRSWTGASQITIACSRGIADQWFMPRLKKLKNDITGLELRLRVTDDVAHLRLDEFDLAIFYRKERPIGVWLSELGQEEVVPVSGAGALTLEEQKAPVLISIEDSMREWQDWGDWWRSSKMSPPQDAVHWKLGDYGLCVAAASQSLGTTLGWTWLIRDQLDSGILVPVHSHTMRSEGRFYLMRPADRHQRKIVREVADWLIANNKQTAR
ncbi:DNA-binding transcriptional LysR family regulator [Agrobacterium larrymoorei]|uniref:DNA-binding transcriptional LysR family regulator n=1 Tax=Agrobacterium larrymoorei TaxID=160699 RepID=A0AAJ2BEM6_9HYPH|nr:LysR substrate-binding domain-containing protein [Agrobacterium larrymoorei]MDR6101526.1 DNA-binding transcriptional LysR family regulator [Agrobacterium larrymoorei]